MSDRIAPRRLYLTADKSEVVGEGDERAAFLLAGEGCQIPADFDGDIPAELLEPVPPAEPDVAEVAEIVETSDELVVEAEKPEPAPTAKKRSRNTADTAEAADTEE